MKPSKNNLCPINILYIIDDLDVGGTEQQIYELVTNIDKLKFNPIVCVINKLGIISKRIEKLGIKVIYKKKKWKFDFFIIFHLIRIIKYYNIDIVQTYLFTSNTWGRIAAIIAGSKYIIASERNVDIWKKNYHFFIDKILSKFSNAIIVNAFSIKTFMIKHKAVVNNFDRRKIFVIYNGVNINRLKSKEVKIEFPSKIIIGTVGRLERAKGQINLIKCAKKLQHNNCIFLIVGDGSLRDYLCNEVSSNDLDDTIILTGQTKQPISWMKVMDIFVLPSLWEGCPNVIIEAMMVGLPIIATDVGGVKEILDEKTGFIIPPNDVEALASSIITLINNKKARKVMGNLAQEKALRLFSVDQMVSKHEELYLNLFHYNKL